MDILLNWVAWDLKYNLWFPAYRLIRGESPYQSGVWFPQAIGAFIPLGWLDEYQASLLWLLLSLALIGAIIWVLGARSPIPFGLSFGLILLFPQTFTHLLLGQFSVLTIMLLLTSLHFILRRQPWITGFLIAIALIKPQLVVLVAPGLVILSYRIGGMRSIVKLGLACLASVTLLTIPLWLLYPQWGNDFIVMQSTKPEWYQPNLFVMLRLWLGSFGLYAWLVLFLIVSVMNVHLWLSLQPLQACVWSLALTVLISPYIWTWDFVLLLPLLVYLLTHSPTQTRILLAIGYVPLWLLNWWIRLSADGGEERFWIVPLLLLIVAYAATNATKLMDMFLRISGPSSLKSPVGREA